MISGVCDSTSPVKANVMLVRLLVVAAVVGVIETSITDDVVPEVVELQPVVMQANANVN